MTESEPAAPFSDLDRELYGPGLQLDELLTQLIARAQDLRAAHSRLRGLLRANNMIIGDLALPVVLRRIVEAACQLVHARYGALGVVAPDGGLEQFIHIGIDAELVVYPREGHQAKEPAHVEDQRERILRWLGTYLEAPR